MVREHNFFVHGVKSVLGECGDFKCGDSATLKFEIVENNVSNFKWSTLNGLIPLIKTGSYWELC